MVILLGILILITAISVLTLLLSIRGFIYAIRMGIAEEISMFIMVSLVLSCLTMLLLLLLCVLV